jgi:hypothetical protein
MAMDDDRALACLHFLGKETVAISGNGPSDEAPQYRASDQADNSSQDWMGRRRGQCSNQASRDAS